MSKQRPDDAAGAENRPDEGAVEPTENEDYAGYPTLEAMRDATYESRREGKRLADENHALNARIAEIERRLPSERAAERRALDEINDLGLPAETFRRAVREELEIELAPKRKTDAAVASVRRANPDFQKFEAEFTDWLADNPQVSASYANTVAAAPDAAELALEGVFAQFSRSKASAVRNANPAPRLSPDAALAGSQSGGGAARRVTQPKLGRDELQALIKGARANSDPVPLMRAILGDTPVHRDIERLKG